MAVHQQVEDDRFHTSLASEDILTVHVDQKVAREFYTESLKVEPIRQDACRDQTLMQKSSRGRKSPRREA